jgi:hypothetical protein
MQDRPPKKTINAAAEYKEIIKLARLECPTSVLGMKTIVNIHEETIN